MRNVLRRRVPDQPARRANFPRRNGGDGCPGRRRRRSRRYDPAALTLCSIGSHSALDVALRRAAVRPAQPHRHRARPRTDLRASTSRAADDPPRGCVDDVLELDAFRRHPRARRAGAPARARTSCSCRTARSRSTCTSASRTTRSSAGCASRCSATGGCCAPRSATRRTTSTRCWQRAGIRHPRSFARPDRDRPARHGEGAAREGDVRARVLPVFVAGRSTTREAERLIDAGMVTRSGLRSARIEEYALGPSVNLNFFYSPLLGEVELLGTDTRRQTNLDGLRVAAARATRGGRRRCRCGWKRRGTSRRR